MVDIEWVMANYSQPQLLKNRRSILNALAFANVVLLILVVAGRTSITAAVVFSLIFLAVAGVMWWLFASKDSSTIDGTWVDGGTTPTRQRPSGRPTGCSQFRAVGDESHCPKTKTCSTTR